MRLAEAENSFPSAFRRGARGTVDIVADILHLCRSGRNKTAIMYRANLSHQMLKFYLWHMVDLGLLQESDGMKFKTTEIGEEFLLYYQKLADTLSGLGSARKSSITQP